MVERLHNEKYAPQPTTAKRAENTIESNHVTNAFPIEVSKTPMIIKIAATMPMPMPMPLGIKANRTEATIFRIVTPNAFPYVASNTPVTLAATFSSQAAMKSPTKKSPTKMIRPSLPNSSNCSLKMIRTSLPNTSDCSLTFDGYPTV
jgi:hypothetical protein